MTAGVVAAAEFAPASGVGALAWLLFGLPAFGAAVLFLAGRRANAWGHLLGCATVAGSFAIGVALFVQSLGAGDSVGTELKLFSWIPVGSLNVDFGLRLDPLSLTFVLLITVLMVKPSGILGVEAKVKA